MPETYKSFGEVREIAISTGSRGGSIEQGDILCVRKPVGHCGMAERGRMIWIRVTTELDSTVLDQLGEPFIESDVLYQKRRYSVPLNRIAEKFPSFDINRALDEGDHYQPFVGTPDTPYGVKGNFQWAETIPPFDIEGFVFDKATMRFL